MMKVRCGYLPETAVSALPVCFVSFQAVSFFMSKISMKTIPVAQAAGTVLCHDITRIEPGGQKGPVFRKGHVVREEDIPVLLSVGKENLYVYEPLAGQLHENDAALRIGRAVAGRNLAFSDIKEGRINFLAEEHGLLRVDVPALSAVNA